ncbi:MULTISPECIES: hypothetical protein [unclassified Anaerobiospirillum]|uniref:hypothetical protein n=1 Tax=unclassified Anaerobiospirillum TaxID=2647410 RepID=UPI001FF20991|nr:MULTISPECIES: hypothetical protein [unclassified Anaerobiospirillum]MCK0533747.1 hypothetical protein [Anaerobiospirillum sp. NML120511]MCK0539061.1 hypothetical protein [Anaerobiospirillum sp. NML02-A-032]
MVGLYHKRRAERSTSSIVMRILMRLGFTAGVFIVIGFALTALFFNGSQVKGPLSVYLSSRSGMDVTIRDAEFSPVYPDVIKLYDVSFGNSSIGELYIEYDLRSAISGEDLIINDLYLNKISMDQEDLVNIAHSRFGFNSVRAQTVRFHGTPLRTEFLSAADATIRLNQVLYSSKDGLTFRSGALSTSNARLFEDEVKSFSIDFTHSAEGIAINSFSAAIFGGTVTGRGLYSLTHPDHEPLTAAGNPPAASGAGAAIAAATAGAAAGKTADVAGSKTADTAAGKTADTADSKPAESTDSKTAQADTKTGADTAVAAATATAGAASDSAKAARTSEAPESQKTDAVAVTSPQKPADGCPPADAYIILDELNLSKIIVNDSITAPKGIVLTSKNTFLKDVILTNSPVHVPAPSRKKGTDADKGKKVFTERDAQSSAMTASAQSTGSRLKGRDGDDPQSYIMQGISGSMQGLMIHDKAVSGAFKGEVDEISFPNLQTTFEHNTVTADFGDGSLNFALRGQVYEGLIQTEGNIDFDKRLIELDDLKLAKNKMAINPPRLEWIKDSLTDSSLFIHQAQFKDMEFLSYINALPLSIQAISGSAENLYLHPDMKPISSAPAADQAAAAAQSKSSGTATDKAASGSTALVAPELDVLLGALGYMVPQSTETVITTAASSDSTGTSSSASDTQDKDDAEMFSRPSVVELQLKNMLYSDLLMSQTKATLKLNQDSLTISVPQMRFKESSISAHAQLGLKPDETSTMQIKAPDFESADLNSNLIGHMLTGKTSFNIELTGRYADNTVSGLSLLKGTYGHFTLTSDNMLAADFGLDLINGGKKEDYHLTGTELMTAIQGSVAGMAKLNTRGDLRNGRLVYSTATSLVTSDLRLQGQADLISNTVSGTGKMESLARDSATAISISGKVSAPIFDIKAIKRGEKRPGLYLPQYEASAQAKEQTDAASELKKQKLKAAQANPAEAKPDVQTAPATKTDDPDSKADGQAESAPASLSDRPADPAAQAASSASDEKAHKATDTMSAEPAGQDAPATKAEAADNSSAEPATPAAPADAAQNKDESKPADSKSAQPSEFAPGGTTDKAADQAAPAAPAETAQKAAKAQPDDGAAHSSGSDKPAAPQPAEKTETAAPDESADKPAQTKPAEAAAPEHQPESTDKAAKSQTAVSTAVDKTETTPANAPDTATEPKPDAASPEAAKPAESAEPATGTETAETSEKYDAQEAQTKPAEQPSAQAPPAAPDIADNASVADTSKAADANPAKTSSDDARPAETASADAADAARTAEVKDGKKSEPAALAQSDDRQHNNPDGQGAAPATAATAHKPATSGAEAEADRKDRMMHEQADITEKELLKNAIIDSIIANGTEEYDDESEEELIF